ncbi:MAG: DUF2147 domain-containing protein [Proteobacteria bacterium]|nr:DUF2147 domain-containing protein [Pseudomonadota bacterium]
MRRRDWLAGAIGLSGVSIASFASVSLALPALAAASDSPVGFWRTIDDKTHKPRAIVRIFPANGMLYGVVTAILDPKYAGALCQDCGGDRKGQPVLGLQIIRGMKPAGDHWGGGTILNPQTGEVYHCQMHVGDGGQTLVVRGFIGFSFIGRSQTWQRVSG